MKKVIFFCLLATCCFNYSFSQGNIDSLNAKIDSLERKLNNENYTRIPNKDFDNILSQKVNEEVSDQIDNVKKWIAIIEGLIVLCLGFFAKYYFKDMVQKELKETSAKLEASINDLIDKRLTESIGIIWDDVASNLLSKAKQSNYQDDSIINSISHFLETENLKVSDDLKSELITALVRSYFYSAKKDKVERLMQIITKYENEKIKIKPETYADAAIVFCDNYEYFGTQNFYNSSVEYADKSINALPDYGVAYAIKFEVFLISYKKAGDDATEKANALDNIKRLFRSISNNKSDVVCAEAIVRFEDDTYLKDYLGELNKQFTNEMKEMNQRAFNYLIRTPTYINTNPLAKQVFDRFTQQGYVAVV